jgi:hypothetical protein
MIWPSLAQTASSVVAFISAGVTLRARDDLVAGQVPSPLAPSHINPQKKYQAQNGRDPKQEHEIPNTKAEQLGRFLRGQAVRQSIPGGSGKKQDPV